MYFMQDRQSKYIISLMLISALSISGCSLLFKENYYEDNNKIFLAKCNSRVNFYKKELNKLIRTNSNRSDRNFINEFDSLYYNLIKKNNRDKSLSKLHPDSNIRSQYNNCATEFKKIHIQLLSNSLLYNRFLQVEANHSEDINLYKEKAIKLMIFNGAHLTKNQIKQLFILKENATLLKNRFLIAYREEVRSIVLKDDEPLKYLPNAITKKIKNYHDDSYTLSTKYNIYYPVMANSHQENIRKALYIRQHQRGYPKNRKILQDLLKIREEIARLIGFDNYAAYMATSHTLLTTTNIKEFLENLEKGISLNVSDEITTLHSLNNISSKSNNNENETNKIGEWNYRYLKTQILDNAITSDFQQLEFYFPLKSTIEKMIQFIGEIYSIQFRKNFQETWHDSVVSYTVYNKDRPIAIVHFDLLKRPNKYNEITTMPINYGLRDESLPEIALTAKLAYTLDDNQYLHPRKVVSLMHQFGHIIHLIFSGNQRYGLFTGNDVEIDFLEVPALIHENIFWQWDVFKKLSTQENKPPLKHEVFLSLLKRRNLFIATEIQRHISYSQLALHIYEKDTSALNLNILESKVFKEHSPFKNTDNTFFYASFGNIVHFDISYYSMLWARAISEDLFQNFFKGAKNGNLPIEKYIQNILMQGGKKTSWQLIEDLIGRPIQSSFYIQRLNNSISNI